MTEVRNFPEGSMRWVQASGTGTLGGTAFATASAPTNALVGYVREGLAYTSAREFTTVMERGLPSHHKFTQATPPEVTFDFLNAVTANKPPVDVTGAGVSVPSIHVELKSDAPELGSDSAVYYYFTQGVVINDNLTENNDGNSNSMTIRFLTMFGPTATGYLS